MTPSHFSFLLCLGLAIALVGLGTRARGRRRKTGAGDMFMDAIRDKRYLGIILAMLLALLLSALCVLRMREPVL